MIQGITTFSSYIKDQDNQLTKKSILNSIKNFYLHLNSLNFFFCEYSKVNGGRLFCPLKKIKKHQ